MEEEQVTGEEGGEGETKKRRPRKRARKTAPSSQLPVVFANSLVGEIGEGGGGGGGGEEETLSDLDDEIDEYILTEEQVSLHSFSHTSQILKPCFPYYSSASVLL